MTSIKSESYRIQATKFNFPTVDLLIINLYFMVDTQAGNFDDTKLMDLLAEVDRIIHTSDNRNILLVGDLNCDFERNTPLEIYIHFYI